MDNNLQFIDAYMEEQYIYFSASNVNGLFRLKRGVEEAEFLGYFEKEPLWQTELHRQVFELENKLYFVPFNGRGISIYDIKTGQLSFVEIDTKHPILVSKAFMLKNDIFMICSNLKDPFIIFHTENNECEFARGLRDTVREKLSPSEVLSFNLFGACLHDGKIYLAVQNTNKILTIDLIDRNINIYNLSGEYKLRNIYVDNETFYFTQSEQGGIVRWSIQTNDCYEYSTQVISETTDYPYITLIRWEGRLLLLPGQADNILELDEEKDEWHVKPNYVPKDFFRIKKGRTLFAGYHDIEGKLFLFPRRGNGMICISKEKSELYRVHCTDEVVQKTKKIRKDYLKEQVCQRSILFEGEWEESSLNYMLSDLLNASEKENSVSTMNMGKNIWRKTNF